MINSIVKHYQQSKMSIITKLSGEYDILDECELLDDGYIFAKTEKIKKRLAYIEQEIQNLIQFQTNESFKNQKIHTFLKEQQSLHYSFSFLISNNIQYVSQSLDLLENEKTDFTIALKGLKAYKEQNEQDAFRLLMTFYENKKKPIEHYLVNKVFGRLLMNNQAVKESIPFLRKALEKKPNDIEIHRWLYNIYLSNDEKKLSIMKRYY